MSADVVLGDERLLQSDQAKQSMYKMGQLHRIGNSGTEEMIFIEVQTGTYFGEDDIERIQDDYAS